MWSGCSDSHIKNTGEHGKFVDAFLKLSTNIPLMYTENHDVANIIAMSESHGSSLRERKTRLAGRCLGRRIDVLEASFWYVDPKTRVGQCPSLMVHLYEKERCDWLDVVLVDV